MVSTCYFKYTLAAKFNCTSVSPFSLCIINEMILYSNSLQSNTFLNRFISRNKKISGVTNSDVLLYLLFLRKVEKLSVLLENAK